MLNDFYTKLKVDGLYDLAWFAVSTLLLAWILPLVIEARRYKKQARIRRLIASRISRAQLTLAAYLRAIAEAKEGRELNQSAVRDIKNAVHHLVGAASQFGFALDGRIGESYFDYRISFTNVAISAARRLGHFDEFLESLFFTNLLTPEGSIDEVNVCYKRCLDVLGPDIEGLATMQAIIAPYTHAEVTELQAIYDSTRP